MMKNYILLLFILISFVSFSQSKYAKKSQKLFEKGEYEKCIDKTKKFLAKERKSADLQYYIFASEYRIYQGLLSETKKKIKLKKLIKSYKKLEQWNTAGDVYTINKDSLHQAIVSFLPQDTIERTEHRFFYTALTELFADTVSQFHQLNAPRKVAVNVVEETTDSITLLRQKITDLAYSLVGTKYKYGGVDAKGFDCSGYTQYLYASIGVDLPHNAHAQSKLGKEISLKEARPGDLIFFGSKRASHAGLIYDNKDGKIELIHSVTGGVSHQLPDSYDGKYWLGRVYKVKRILAE